ncbi:hypothetical protein HWV62_2432 [Athelia sp. TMB]|nr:hypothetical protein HWV62_2432 [Athelia sp. TMB]
MSLPPLNLDDHHEILLPQSPEASLTRLTLEALDAHQLTAPPLQSSISSSSTDSGRSPFLLPIPTPTANSSQASFVYSDALNTDSEQTELGDLPPEIATADISIAPDGSFVETSSGLAARELKRRYDQMFGVNLEVRSPYAITAFVNQHGKQMFRVGHRDMTPPAASAEKARLSIHDVASQPGSGSHISVPALLQLSSSTKPPPNHPYHPNALNPPSNSADSMSRTGNKLRKTRSIPESFNASSSAVNLAGPSVLHTGRGHSHSVTGVDIYHHIQAAAKPKPPKRDTFGEVMGFVGAIDGTTSPVSSARLGRFARPDNPQRSASSSRNRPDPTDPNHTPEIIAQPFGPGIDFEVPARKDSPAEYLQMPHAHGLREMQSFESGLTARAGDHVLNNKRMESPLCLPEMAAEGVELTVDIDATAEGEGESTPHASFIPVINEPEPPSGSNIWDPDAQPEEPKELTLTPLPETVAYGEYRADVFDTLQTYRGLPRLDRLDRLDADKVIRMSYRPHEPYEKPTPRDDPRFVLWATRRQPAADPEDFSLSQADISSGTGSHASRGRSGRTNKHASISVPSPPLVEGAEGGTQRVIAAATIERWIAQLTSDLNYDELLDFFLTYRSYINALELCRLLICRFHWSLGKSPESKDDTVRRIVRIRTFVAIRYWLLTFFNVDFLPNRDLRVYLAAWLNALIRDPILKKHSDGLSIVRKLCKVAKDCRDAHTKKHNPKRMSAYKSATVRSTGSLLGEKFAAATFKEEDSDVDLDFLPEEAIDIDGRSPGFPKESANAHLSAVHDGTGLSAVPKPTAVPSAQQALLQQPLPLILQQRRAVAPGANGEVSFMPSAAALPVHHQNSLSRAFVKTIGRLGHWKRVLNSRNGVHNTVTLGPSEDVSAFDLELSAGGDLLAFRGGMEQYLKFISPNPVTNPAASSAPEPPRASHTTMASETVVGDDTSMNGLQIPPIHQTDVPSDVGSMQSSLSIRDSATNVPSEDEIQIPSQSPAKAFKKPRARSSSGSSSDSSFGAPFRAKPQATPPGLPHPRMPYAFDVVSIDDLDLSDASSDCHETLPAPPGLKKPSRKLPLRRDFEFVRRSRETVSSMGIISHRSVLSDTSVISAGEPELGGGGIFQQWQLNAIVDSLSDDEESGDIEATLRRLEGQINPQKQQEKVSKVDGWVKTIQRRMAAGDYTNEAPRFLDEEEGAEDGEPDFDDDFNIGSYGADTDNDDDARKSVSQGPSSKSSQESLVHTGQQSSSNPVSPRRSPQQKPVPEDAVPLEILQSRVPSRPSTSHGKPDQIGSPLTLSNSLAKVLPSKPYHSWIMGHRTQTLVEHFTVIDRELFMGVKFEELVQTAWMTCEEVNIYDWVQFLKERARWKAESRNPEKTGALGAVRARFNLLANFTISEILLTPLSERQLVLKKFVRMAWKAYLSCSYNTLVAIMAGLQSDWVKKAANHAWNRLSSWESRVYNDLKAWVSSSDDFKFIRQAVATMLDAKPINAGSHVTADVSTSGTDALSSKSKLTVDGKPLPPQTCVPFIGVYLSQLYRHTKLPGLIDPTAPHEAVGTYEGTAHPEVFSELEPLPPTIRLEPLINVHKQRLIADVIKTMVAGQHLASRVQYPVDKKLFQKCLKLRGLPDEDLRRALAAH